MGLGPALGYRAVPLAELNPKLNAETAVIVMLETAEGIENCESIAAVEGIDVLLIGSGDLTTDLGIPGQVDHPRLRAAYERVAAACRTHKKVLGRRRHPPQHRAARRTDRARGAVRDRRHRHQLRAGRRASGYRSAARDQARSRLRAARHPHRPSPLGTRSGTRSARCRMPREYFRCLGVSLATWLPVAVVLGALEAARVAGRRKHARGCRGDPDTRDAGRDSVRGLARGGTQGDRETERGETQPVSAAAAPFVARALWPGLMRLRGAYDTRLVQAETRLAAAEAIIAAIPDPLLLIDIRRRIVRANRRRRRADRQARRARRPGGRAAQSRAAVRRRFAAARRRPAARSAARPGSATSNSLCRDQPIGCCVLISPGSTGRRSTARSRF